MSLYIVWKCVAACLEMACVLFAHIIYNDVILVNVLAEV